MGTKAFWTDMTFWAALVAGISSVYIIIQPHLGLPVLDEKFWAAVLAVIGTVIGFIRQTDNTKPKLGLKTKRSKK